MDYLIGPSGENAVQGKVLRVRVGPSVHLLQPAAVNDELLPHYIDSPYFVGRVLVRIKNFTGILPKGAKKDSASEAYFAAHKRLFSVQVQGRFKHVRGLATHL